MLHPAQAEEVVGELLDFLPSAFYDDHFQAVSMVEMDVGHGQHFSMVMMLGSDQVFGEFRLMVVIDQRQSSDDDPVLGHVRRYRMLTDQIADGLRAAAVSLARDRAKSQFESALT